MKLLTPDFVMYSLHNQILETCSSGNLALFLSLEPCIGDLASNKKSPLFLSCAISAGQFSIVRCLLRKGVKPINVDLPDILYENTRNEEYREIKKLLIKYK